MTKFNQRLYNNEILGRCFQLNIILKKECFHHSHILHFKKYYPLNTFCVSPFEILQHLEQF